MISPELLRRYPFFAALNAAEIKQLALISEAITPAVGAVLFQAEEPAAALYVLINGCVELWCVASDQHAQGLRREFYLHDVNPGELLGLSALIAPYRYQSEARVTAPSALIQIQAPALRDQCEADARLGLMLMRQIAQAAMHRLHDTRVQLVAARG
jgi:CRP-like cAMP-binding protein